jgi:hypothetical protein
MGCLIITCTISKESNLYLYKVTLPGQYVDVVHEDCSVPLPTHCFPSYLGAGSVQDLVLVHVPLGFDPPVLQLTEQLAHEFHAAHSPSTIK